MRAKEPIPKLLFIIIIFPTIFHVGLYLSLYTYYNMNILVKPIKIGLLHHKGAGDVELWGLYGDAFNPRVMNIDFDIVLVSATLNPFAVLQSKQGRIIVWQQNDLLRSALANTYVDEKTFIKAVKEMVVSMGQNGSLVRYFLKSEYDFNKSYYLKDLVHVYFWDVPNNSSFHASTGINAMIAVPIFDTKYMHRTIGDNSLMRERLRDNVFIVIKRALELIGDLEDQKAYPVHSIAIPPLAGTCCRIDSWLYLNYITSYFTILSAMESSKIPNTIDRIYMITYSKLPTIEKKSSIHALFRIYSYYNMKYWLDNDKFYLQGQVLRSLVWVLPFFFLLVLTHRKRKFLIRPRQRQEFLLNLYGLTTVYLIVAVMVNETILEYAKGKIAIVIVGDIVFGLASMLVLSWLNNRWISIKP